jgi:hypothetical protein
MDAPDDPLPDPRSKAAASPRALIVDDDPGFLLGLTELVRREGFAVASAGSWPASSPAPPPRWS